jgi:hypothetical protein
MNDNDNGNNFEPLRRLLALKRHEIPPPGYFNSFSGQVVSRIRSDAAKKSTGVFKDLSLEESWLFKLLQAFSAKPAFASSFASALCLLLVFGIVFAERPDYSAPQPLLAQATETSVPLADASQATLPSDQTMFASDISSNSLSSLQPVASPFGSQNPFAQQVSFSIPGN